MRRTACVPACRVCRDYSAARPGPENLLCLRKWIFIKLILRRIFLKINSTRSRVCAGRLCWPLGDPLAQVTGGDRRDEGVHRVLVRRQRPGRGERTRPRGQARATPPRAAGRRARRRPSRRRRSAVAPMRTPRPGCRRPAASDSHRTAAMRLPGGPRRAGRAKILTDHTVKTGQPLDGCLCRSFHDGERPCSERGPGIVARIAHANLPIFAYRGLRP